MDDRQLQTAWLNRQSAESATHISESLTKLLKNTLAKRVKQLGAIAAVWDKIIPAEYRDHTALEAYNRGTLTVMVDSSSHRFALDSLLKSGLKDELAAEVTTPLNRIKLIPGQFYAIDLAGNPRFGPCGPGNR